MDAGKSRKINKTSRFAIMARRPGGVPREKAMARADARIEELSAKYLDWVAKDLLALETRIDAVHQLEGARREEMDAAYSKSAEIRDLGATFGFPLTTEVADRLCELIDRLRHAGTYSYDALATHLGALQLVCTERFRGKQAADEKPLLDGLSRVIAKYPAVSTDSDEGEPA
ncbi:MAG: hypothetical protein HQ495_13910 [Alphaproteobacteria bacterium]|nr:hypothetical protein [Alphaproteobacteria bacterium]